MTMTPEEYADNLNLSLIKLDEASGLTNYYKTIRYLTHDEPETFARTVTMMSEKSIEHMFTTAKELMEMGLLTCPTSSDIPMVTMKSLNSPVENPLTLSTKLKGVALLIAVALFGALIASMF